ncbi:MAG: hypothetical protein RL681_389 [Candidatus Parcubacteria bacterium]|jgi:cell division protein FtsB
MRVVLLIILTSLLLFLGSQLWYFYKRGETARADLESQEEKLQAIQREHDALSRDADYYGNTANIEKELRGKFNYKSPGETMMVIVPDETTSTTTTRP